jgi:hypothetical protein
MDFLTAMILEKMGEGGPEIMARMFAASLCLDMFLLAWCAFLTIAPPDK